VLAASLGLLLLPALAHRGQAARAVVQRRKGVRERAILAIAGIAFLLGLVWVATPLFQVADYTLRPELLAAGIVAYAMALFMLYRSHRDLAAQWSITLEVREQHALVTHGVYRRVRHPMYLALLLYGTGQALALPNFVAGPAYLAATLALVALRMAPEERMMEDTFGSEYRNYAARTSRLLPGVW
jgi:protein-S-isoprenylcysteine O-methyltransferase Ste14